jgi:hypothetical protein
MEIHVDWTDLEEAYDGYVRVMFFTDALGASHTVLRDDLRI